MIKLKQKENESREKYLVRLAIEYIEDHTGFIGVDDYLYYDGEEVDGFFLANDLRIEFNIEE